MKKIIPMAFIATLCTTLSSCELIEGIFKTGMWTGIILVVIIIALLGWLISKLFGGNKE
ncbi:hypothetical protein [Pedobacter sp. ASV28]|uniref:hypothetical protein n=1 Tax=Pedobacter sp. ASV28 TaxID=2795123 RepID=UPI0018EE123D|nr:hypothetical protein [Pedobacter sp. ASV28]